MANTLYDLLEVSTSASPESIAASYQRLHAHYATLQSGSESEDATNRLIALREAYTTLSNPERRKAYDDKLASRAAVEVVQIEQPRSSLRLVLLAAVIGISGLGYANYQSNREQAAIRQAEIEAQRVREQEERERVAAQQADQQRQQAEARERYERERDLAYGRQVSRDIQRGEAMALQEKQREEQQRQYEAERRLAQDKATVRRLEAENNRRYY